jgi:hypothetical protein
LDTYRIPYIFICFLFFNCIRLYVHTDDDAEAAEFGYDDVLWSNEDVAAGWVGKPVGQGLLVNGDAFMDVVEPHSAAVVSGPSVGGPSCAVPVLLGNAQAPAAVAMDGVRLYDISASETVSAAVLLAISNAGNAESERAEVLMGCAAGGIAFDADASELEIVSAAQRANTCMVSAHFSSRGALRCLEASEAASQSIFDASPILVCVSAASAASAAATSAKLLKRCAEAQLEECVRAEFDVGSLCARMKLALEAAQVQNAAARLVSSVAHTAAFTQLQKLRDTFGRCLVVANKVATYLEFCTSYVSSAVDSSRNASKYAAATSLECDRVRAMHSNGGNAKPGTPQWYKQRLRDKLFPGSKFTLQQAVYGLLMWKRVYSVGRQAMDTLIKIISTRMLPRGHILPPTLHLLQRVSEAQEWDEYEVHVCGKKSCQGHAWDYIPRANWKEHSDDVCPHCSGPRFKSSNVTGTFGLTCICLSNYIRIFLKC